MKQNERYRDNKMILKNGQELHIRKAEKKDATELIEFLNTVSGESDNLLFGAGEFSLTVWQEEQFIQNMNSSLNSALFVGLTDGRIVCVGSVSTPGNRRISHQTEIAVSVLKEFWGIGVGKCLMNEIINFARTNKLEILHLGVKEDNIRAIELYNKLGFTKIGVYPKFFKINGQYYDQILMNLYLT